MLVDQCLCFGRMSLLREWYLVLPGDLEVALIHVGLGGRGRCACCSLSCIASHILSSSIGVFNVARSESNML